MTVLTIADVGIRQDDVGRFSLNDLHRAAGGLAKHQPANWLRTNQAQELVTELDAGSIPQIRGIESKQGLGTFAAKELVYAYAMWISPAFHLKVIRAYDAAVTSGDRREAIELLNDPAAMRGLLLSYTERVIELEQEVEVLAPKAVALDRFATGTEGSLCLTDAAKALQVRPRQLTDKLQEMRWIHRRPMGTGWLAYQERLQSRVMEHKLTKGERSDGTEWVSTQVRVTAKGIARLSQILTNGAQPPLL